MADKAQSDGSAQDLLSRLLEAARLRPCAIQPQTRARLATELEMVQVVCRAPELERPSQAHTKAMRALAQAASSKLVDHWILLGLSDLETGGEAEGHRKIERALDALETVAELATHAARRLEQLHGADVVARGRPPDSMLAWLVPELARICGEATGKDLGRTRDGPADRFVREFLREIGIPAAGGDLRRWLPRRRGRAAR